MRAPQLPPPTRGQPEGRGAARADRRAPAERGRPASSCPSRRKRNPRGQESLPYGRQSEKKGAMGEGKALIREERPAAPVPTALPSGALQRTRSPSPLSSCECGSAHRDTTKEGRRRTPSSAPSCTLRNAMRGEGGPFLHLRVRHQLTRRTPRRAAIGALRCRLITWRGTNPPPRPAVAGAQPLRGCGGMAFVHAPEESWRGGRGEAVPGAREAGGRMGCARAVSRRGGRRWDRHRPAPQETAPPGPRSARGRGGAVGAGGTPRRAERRLLPRRHSGTPRAFRSAPRRASSGQPSSHPPRPARRRRSLGPSSHARCRVPSPALVADAMGTGIPAVAAQ